MFTPPTELEALQHYCWEICPPEGQAACLECVVGQKIDQFEKEAKNNAESYENRKT